MKIRYLLLALLMALCVGLVACDEDGIPDSSSSSSNDHVHSYETTIVAPTCTEQGYTLQECECGSSGRSNYVNALGHNLDDWKTVVESSCTAEGKKEIYCLTCKALVEEKTTPKLSHPYNTTVISPTCTEKGYTKHICGVCAHTYNDSYVSETPHIEGEAIVIKNATCKQTGEEEFRCVDCNAFIRKQTVGVISCNFLSYSIEASGTEEAHTLYVCSLCGDSHKGPYIPNSAIQQITAKEIYENTRPAMVEIVTYDKAGKAMSVGSGFFISEDGYIATNYHVIRGAYSISVVKYSTHGAITSVKVAGYDANQDVAILKIETSGEKYLEFATEAPKTGDTVYALGSTLGLTDTFTMGMISNPNRYVTGKYCLQFTAPISGGNSGGPLLNSDGKVIGVVTLTVPSGQNINFAIKGSVVEALDKVKLDTPLAVSTVYENTLEINALHILKYHIMNNHTACDGEVYYIFEYDPQSATSLGREYYYVYDSANDELFLQIDVIASKTGMNRLTITVVLDDDGDGKFAFSMYDYEFSQNTIAGYLDHKATLKVMGATFDADKFDAVFEGVDIKYLETDTENAPSKMKTLLYQSYSSLIAKFAKFLASTQTGIDAELLGISLPQ